MEKLERELLLEREGVVYERVLREELFMEYDRLSAALLYDEPYAQENEVRMCKLLQMLTEPALWPMYRTLDPYFYQKYFE